MSASWLKRALVTSALAAGAVMLSGGVAHAGDLPGGAPDPVSSILTVEAVAPLQLRAAPAGLVPSA